MIKSNIDMIVTKKYSGGYYAILFMWILLIPFLFFISVYAWNNTLPYYETLFREPGYLITFMHKKFPYIISFLIIINMVFIYLFLHRHKLWGVILACFIFLFSLCFFILLLFVAHFPYYELIYFPRHGGWINPKIICTQTPIVDKNIVLLKKGKVYGALIFNDQKCDDDGNFVFRCKFYYRDDGLGTFNSKDKNVHKKIFDSAKNKVICFGPFDINYSPCFRGTGAIRYEYGAKVPISDIRPNALGICITEERDINEVDAANSKWIYRASPVDWNGVVCVNQKKKRSSFIQKHDSKKETEDLK